MGFIGSNFINYYFDKYPHKDFSIVNLDCLTYAANVKNVEGIDKYKNYSFVKGDICNEDVVNYIFSHYDINYVVNFAAHSHVDNSINNPQPFFQTNVLGTQNLLNCANKAWASTNNHKFLHISTDEVMGSLPLCSKEKWTEGAVLNPRSPYSASKAGAEHVCMAYYHTYKLPVVITRSSNNFGPRQHAEKFIPVIINSLFNKNSIPIYGNGSNMRDWIYVEDNCKCIDLILNKGELGNVYNIGSGREINNKNLVDIIISIFCKLFSENKNFYNKLISYVEDRKGHDLKYSININKIKKLGWEPSLNNSFYDELQKTIMWYKNEQKTD